MKTPRKLKKALKKAVLFKKDIRWRSYEVRLNRVEKLTGVMAERMSRVGSDGQPYVPHYKNLFVTSYSLL